MAASSSPRIPAGACDTHVHVLDPQRFPYEAERTYTPAPATLTDLESHLAEWGVSRTVLVQPSVYGTDNSALLDGLDKLGTRARGIAVIDPATTTDAELAALHARGVRGLRVNVAVRAAAGRVLVTSIDRASALGLTVEIYASLDFLSAHRATLAAARVPILLDHFAGIDPAAGFDQPGVKDLSSLLNAGHVWMKLSAPYRLPHSPSLDAVAEVARILIARHPDRLLWASDWPHTGRLPAGVTRTAASIDPFHDFDVPAALAALHDWCGDPDTARAILVDNPATLFGF